MASVLRTEYPPPLNGKHDDEMHYDEDMSASYAMDVSEAFLSVSGAWYLCIYLAIYLGQLI